MTIMKVPTFNNGPPSIGSYLKYIFSKKDLLHYRQRCFEQSQRWNKSIQQDWPWLLFLLWKHFHFRFLSHSSFHLKSFWERSSELQSLVEIPPIGVHVRIGWGRRVCVSVIVCVCCAGRSLDRGGYRWAVVVCDCHLKKAESLETQTKHTNMRIIWIILTSTFVSGEAMPAIDWLNPKDEARKPKPAPRPGKGLSLSLFHFHFSTFTISLSLFHLVYNFYRSLYPVKM